MNPNGKSRSSTRLSWGLPRTRKQWLHLAFCASESIVVMLFLRNCGQGMNSKEPSFIPQFYIYYTIAILILLAISISIRRHHPYLARLGYITCAIAVFNLSYIPAIT